MNPTVASILGQSRPDVLCIRREYAAKVVVPHHSGSDLPLKWNENRTWTPALPCDGSPAAFPLLIHASGPGGAIIGAVTVLKIINTYGREDEDCLQTQRRLKREVKRTYKDAGITLPPPHRFLWEFADDPCDAFDGLYWWVLGHPVKFKKEVPCRGFLRIWQPMSDTLRRVRMQLEQLR